MAEVNSIPAIQSLLFIWDPEATVPAFRPIGCLTDHDFSTTLNLNEVEAIRTFCGNIPAKQTPDGLGFQLSGSGLAVDTTSAGSQDLTKASHDFLLATQKRHRATGDPADFMIRNMTTPGIPDDFGKGWVTELSKAATAEENANQTFTFTITGVSDSLSDTTTVTPEEGE